MNLTTDDLLLIIGAKESEIFALRNQLRQLQATYTDLQNERDDLELRLTSCEDEGRESR